MSPSRKFKVVWSSVAASDLEAILDYIAADHPENALIVLRRIQDKVSKLQNMPNRGKVVPELQAQGITMYRELMHAPWRIIYRLANREVHVLAVIDSRRNIEDTLLERLTRHG
jgi:plasmid stabilization system protein ParE